MRKPTAIMALTLAAVVGSASPAVAHHHHYRHVPAHVCAESWQNPASNVVNRCQRQGWLISVDYDEYDNLWQVLVVSPKGRVVQDSLGSIEVR